METKFIVREAKVVYAPSNVKQSQLPKISCADDAYQVVKKFFDDVMNYQEQFALILLNRNNRVLGVEVISKGGAAGTIADPKIIFHHALIALASSIIVVHNHPSGNLNPSESDRALTSKLSNVATLHDIRFLDHLIVSEDGYYSFADNETI